MKEVSFLETLKTEIAIFVKGNPTVGITNFIKSRTIKIGNKTLRKRKNTSILVAHEFICNDISTMCKRTMCENKRFKKIKKNQ